MSSITVSSSVRSIKESMLEVLGQIESSARKSTATILPDASFSHAINAAGEIFVGSLLNTVRKGRWFCNKHGEWVECSIQRIEPTSSRTFFRGNSEEWNWFPREATRLADPLTGPDHVVEVQVSENPDQNYTFVLEQKLRFGTKQDAFADASTYMKHLLAKLPKESLANRTPAEITNAVKELICQRTSRGLLFYAGTVSHVCFASIKTYPNEIYVINNNETRSIINCSGVGFIAPCINYDSFKTHKDSRFVLNDAEVRLWIGLDSLLKTCENEEVENAWDSAIKVLTENIRSPKWKNR